jgi:hypothetical protein
MTRVFHSLIIKSSQQLYSIINKEGHKFVQSWANVTLLDMVGCMMLVYVPRLLRDQSTV